MYVVEVYAPFSISLNNLIKNLSFLLQFPWENKCKKNDNFYMPPYMNSSVGSNPICGFSSWVHSSILEDEPGFEVWFFHISAWVCPFSGKTGSKFGLSGRVQKGSKFAFGGQT